MNCTANTSTTSTYLVLFNVVDGEIKPKAVPWIAGVRPQKEIVFELAHQVGSTQIARFEGGIKAQVASFRFATVARRANDDAAHIAQATFAVAVVAFYI